MKLPFFKLPLKKKSKRMNFKSLSPLILPGAADRWYWATSSNLDLNPASGRQFWLQRAGQASLWSQRVRALILWNCNNLEWMDQQQGAWRSPQSLCDGILCFYRANLINVAQGSMPCMFRLSYHMFPCVYFIKTSTFMLPLKWGSLCELPSEGNQNTVA